MRIRPRPRHTPNRMVPHHWLQACKFRTPKLAVCTAHLSCHQRRAPLAALLRHRSFATCSAKYQDLGCVRFQTVNSPPLGSLSAKPETEHFPLYALFPAPRGAAHLVDGRNNKSCHPTCMIHEMAGCPEKSMPAERLADKVHEWPHVVAAAFQKPDYQAQVDGKATELC